MKNHQNIYQLRFEYAIASGLSITDAACTVTEAYLDNKPDRKGKPSVNAVYRNTEFWSAQFIWELSAATYESEPLLLALSRYMSQQQVSNAELIQHIAHVVPESVRKAVRYSGIVLKQDSARWKEIECLAETNPVEFSEIVKIGHRLQHAHRIRLAEIDAQRILLAELSPLELLVYASLYGFEHLIPTAFNSAHQSDDSKPDVQEVWEAINDILIWKLRNSADSAFHLTEAEIGHSLREHLSPFLFASPGLPKVREDIYLAFGLLVDAQLELNSFLSRSVEAFCYNDNVKFEFAGADLVITQLNQPADTAWEENGKRFARLHQYWFYRAMEEFVASGMATEQIGRPENHHENQIAFIKAIRTKLQLNEVYGINESILADSGLRVDLFQALLSLELMTAHHVKNMLLPYEIHLDETGDWRQALTMLAMSGLMESVPQNRLPITFSDRAIKIETIRPWTASKVFPQGLAKAAEAILDFWTSDLASLSSQFRSGQSTQIPELHERPMLKMGRYLFQLPWVVAMQNNSTAAINNLRRIGARRSEAREETNRIEQRLGKALEDRGFKVRLNYHPVHSESNNPGEVDIICALDGQVLVLEIKSTFLRRSRKEAWLHKTTTLRKAGLQLRCKVEAVRSALSLDTDLIQNLGLELNTAIPEVRGWIVDTCIEHDHESFCGFVKISLEEMLIALRDERHLLNDPSGLFSNQTINIDDNKLSETPVSSTLYPNGFSGKYFVKVIEGQSVWKI